MNQKEIVSVAIDVFGGAKKAHEWLATPLKKLQGRCPYDELHTDEGREKVFDLLIAIKRGKEIN
jgi:putative toxin-antitoxin system antitoxin component (TIGR02293 family)